MYARRRRPPWCAMLAGGHVRLRPLSGTWLRSGAWRAVAGGVRTGRLLALGTWRGSMMRAGASPVASLVDGRLALRMACAGRFCCRRTRCCRPSRDGSRWCWGRCWCRCDRLGREIEDRFRRRPLGHALPPDQIGRAEVAHLHDLAELGIRDGPMLLAVARQVPLGRLIAVRHAARLLGHALRRPRIGCRLPRNAR